MTWQVFQFYLVCLKTVSGKDLLGKGGGKIVFFLFDPNSTLRERFPDKGSGNCLWQYMHRWFCSTSWLLNKSLETGKINQKKHTFNQYLSCVGWCKCLLSNWAGWSCIFSSQSWKVKAKVMGEPHSSDAF
jgi:hypothetical protein